MRRYLFILEAIFGQVRLSSSPCYCVQDALQQERAIDDQIIYRLNTSVPTASFSDQVSSSEQCKSLHAEVNLCRVWHLSSSLLLPLLPYFLQFSGVHSRRLAAIQYCVDQTRSKVQELSALRDSNPAEAANITKQLRKEQTKVT